MTRLGAAMDRAINPVVRAQREFRARLGRPGAALALPAVGAGKYPCLRRTESALVVRCRTDDYPRPSSIASKDMVMTAAVRGCRPVVLHRSTALKEQLVKQSEDWCRRAEESGIDALRGLFRRKRC